MIDSLYYTSITLTTVGYGDLVPSNIYDKIVLIIYMPLGTAALAATDAGGSAAAAGVSRFESELEINDFPQKARWNVTHKDSLAQISEFTGAVITTRGQYIPPGKQLPIGERKLHLLIEGPTERSVKDAKGKIKEIIEQAVAKEALPGGFGSLGKYKI